MRVAYFCFTLLLACRATAPLAPPDAVPTPVEQEQQLAVPTPLWSPEQRHVSAIHNYLVGEYTLLQGDVRTAHAAFERAYGLDPDPFLGGKSIFTLAELGRIDVALEKSKKMVLLHPRDAYLRFLYGQLLARHGRLQKAQEQLEQALALNRLHIPSHHALIDLHMAQQQWGTARAMAQQMVDEIPSAVYGWSKLSRIHLLLEQPQAALQAARTAYEMKSTNPVLTLIYAFTLAMNGFSDQAIVMYERLYRHNIANEQFIHHLAALYHQLGSLSQVLALLDALVQQRHSVAVDVQRVIILWELKQNNNAHALLQQLLRAHPQAARIVYLTALSEERLGNDSAAIIHYRQLHGDKELGRAASFRLALAYRRQNKFELAQAEMLRLIDSGRTSWNFFAFLADIYDKQKNYRAALHIVERGLIAHPNTIPLLFSQGVYQEKTGNLDGCMRTMRAVIDLDPMHSNALNYLGYLLAEQNIKLQEALQFIQRALALKPNNGYYLDSLAWVYYRLGDYTKAHANILRALRLHPEEAIILEHYADILLKLERRDESLHVYKKALQHVDNEKDQQRIEKKLKQLETNS